jgi:uncharacterized membrane protein YozB (DUF420 family)
MSGIFSTNTVFITDFNLIIQIVTFILILIGFRYKIRKKFQIHGYLMGVAVLLHLGFFIIAMWPSFSAGFEFFTTSTFLIGVKAMWIHAVAGAISLIMGLFIVLTWLLHVSDISKCFKRKRLMDVTLIFWLISLMFGIVTYLGFYFNLGL